MRKSLLFSVLFVCLFYTSRSQAPYSVYSEKPNEKTYEGIISRQILLADTSFHWYAENEENCYPNPKTIKALKAQKDSVQLLVFMGTWCSDSHNVIPKFFVLTDSAGFSNDNITLVGVNRKKKTYSHLCEAMGIINVPTIIVMKNGKEAGRVVEYGKNGAYDYDLYEILNALPK